MSEAQLASIRACHLPILKDEGYISLIMKPSGVAVSLAVLRSDGGLASNGEAELRYRADQLVF
jgi:hypothetical protein